MSIRTLRNLNTGAVILNIVGFVWDMLSATLHADRGDTAGTLLQLFWAAVAIWAIGLCLHSRRELLHIDD